MSDNTIDARERIVIIIDPFTKKAEMFNLMSGCDSVEVDGQIDIHPNEKDEVVVKIDASFTLKGLICKSEKHDKSDPQKQQ